MECFHLSVLILNYASHKEQFTIILIVSKFESAKNKIKKHLTSNSKEISDRNFTLDVIPPLHPPSTISFWSYKWVLVGNAGSV